MRRYSMDLDGVRVLEIPDTVFEDAEVRLAAALAVLRGLGLSRVVWDYSGGNDSGGVDAAQYYDRFGEQTKLPVSDQSLLAALLGAPADDLLSDKYGSFAGDFSVAGEVVLDGKAGSVALSEQHYGEEEGDSDEDSDEDFYDCDEEDCE